MARWRLGGLIRHPVVATAIVLVLFPIVRKLTSDAIYNAELFAAADSPEKITELRLERTFNRDAAERQIRLALSQGDVALAQSFVALCDEQHVSINPVLVEKVKVASAGASSLGNTVRSFFHGLWTGRANTSTSAAVVGDAVSDVLLFGDIRDVAKESWRYLTSRQYDHWMLGLSAAGVVVTAATYFDGLGLPERVGLSLAKIARRSDRLNPALAISMTEAAENGRLVQLTQNAAGVEEKAGMQATLDSFGLARDSEDMARVEQLASAEGSKTRAILKLFGRGAFAVGITGWAVAKWVTIAAVGALSFLFWAVIAVFGVLGWCKTLAGRIARIIAPPRRRPSSL